MRSVGAVLPDRIAVCLKRYMSSVYLSRLP
jgi:hypothetical protein